MQPQGASVMLSIGQRAGCHLEGTRDNTKKMRKATVVFKNDQGGCSQETPFLQGHNKMTCEITEF